jgi:hypothetical protein
MQFPSMSKKMAWGTLAVALLVPAAAQAGGARPDNRAGLRGAEPLVAPVRPDDRAGIRGIGTNLAVRSDERGLERGVGPAAPDVVSRYLRSHPSPSASSSSSAWYSGRSAWFNSGIAAAFVLAAMSLAAAGFLLMRHQRAPAST